MDLEFNLCEVENCINQAYLEFDSGSGKVLRCSSHIDGMTNGYEPKGLVINEAKILKAHIKNAIRNIKKLKVEVLAMAEQISSALRRMTRETLKSIEASQHNLKSLLGQVKLEKRVFTKTQDKVEKYSGIELNAENLNVGLVTSCIKSHFLKDFFMSKGPETLTEACTKLSGCHDMLQSYKITESYLAVSKRLKALSKTEFFNQFDKPKFSYITKPAIFLESKLLRPVDFVISLKNQLVVTYHLENILNVWNLTNIEQGPIYKLTRQNEPKDNKIYEIIGIWLLNEESYVFIAGNYYLKLLDLGKHEICSSNYHDDGNFYLCKMFPDKSKLLMANYDGMVCIYNTYNLIKENSVRIVKPAPTAQITSLSISGNLICTLAGCCNGKTHVWVFQKLKSSVHSFDNHSSPVTFCSFTSNSNYIISYSQSGEIVIQDVKERFKVIHKFKIGPGVLNILFNQEFSSLIAITLDKKSQWMLEPKPNLVKEVVYDSVLLSSDRVIR